MTEKQRMQTAARQQRFRQRQAKARWAEQRSKGLPPMPAITSMPGHARWNAAVSQAQSLLETVHSEMEDYQSGRSDQWQESERGEAFADRVEALANVISEVDSFATG